MVELLDSTVEDQSSVMNDDPPLHCLLLLLSLLLLLLHGGDDGRCCGQTVVHVASGSSCLVCHSAGLKPPCGGGEGVGCGG